ncbi:MAG: M1 family aminopeptidase [Bacteroidota bacterium]|jgi:hypothetical protein
MVCAPAQDRNGDKLVVTAHCAELHLFPSTNALRCIDTLSLRPTLTGTETINLRLLPVYTVEEVTARGKKLDFKRTRDGIEIRGVPRDSTIDVVVTYSGELSFRSDFTCMTTERAVLREEEILPSGPDALQFVRLSVIVPEDWDAITVGRLVSRTAMGGSTQFVWESDQPIPVIGWICAGKFFKALRTDGALPIGVELFPEDSISARKVLDLAENVLKYYSAHFTPFRFPKLSIIEVDDWVAGRNVLAVASPSFIMVKRFAFETTDKFNQVQSILPHEIAHQWWPSTVFVNQDDIAFLSEGLCEYSAKLYDEARGVATLRDSLGHHPLLRSLIMRVAAGKDVPLHEKADLRTLPTHYLKASYVHNMLRHIIGDTVFFRLCKEFARRFNLKPATLSDFQRLAEELSGKELTWFFDQWVNGKGIPRLKIYNVKATRHSGGWLTQGRVRVVGYDKFTTFVEVGVDDSTEVKKTTVWIGSDSSKVYHNDVPFEVFSSHKPKRALLDPDGEVLKIQKLPVKLGDLREPSDGIMIVGSLQHRDYLLSLAQRDSAEMDKAGWSLTIRPDTSVSLGDLQNEMVFLYGRASENRIAANLAGKFPIRFNGDSVIIEKEPLFDSSLTLTQIIENPFVAQGLLCWIAPLSARARPLLQPLDDSWVLTRDQEKIASGTWEVRDPDLVFGIK